MARRLSAVTANLACGGPHPAERVSQAEDWLAAAAEERIDLLFLQECPPGVPDGALGDAYELCTYAGDLPPYRCRSVVAVRRSPGVRAEPYLLRRQAYHRSYLAAATVTVEDAASFIAVSVHASPTPYDRRYAADWGAPLPPVRPVAVRPQLWDADFVLATLQDLACDHDVLAAGDLNEARGYDTSDSPWGALFFERVERGDADGQGILVDVTYRRWAEQERPTCGVLQLDHILATPAIAAVIVDAPDDPAVVSPTEPLHARGSDHRPLRWSLRFGR